MRGYYRWARRGDDGYHYPLHGYVNTVLEDNLPARCLFSSHPAPAAGCTCGYYATRDLYTLFEALPHKPVGIDLLQVHPYGLVLEDKWGTVRSQYQQVLGVVDPRTIAPRPLQGLPLELLYAIADVVQELRKTIEAMRERPGLRDFVVAQSRRLRRAIKLARAALHPYRPPKRARLSARYYTVLNEDGYNMLGGGWITRAGECSYRTPPLSPYLSPHAYHHYHFATAPVPAAGCWCGHWAVTNTWFAIAALPFAYLSRPLKLAEVRPVGRTRWLKGGLGVRAERLEAIKVFDLRDVLPPRVRKLDDFKLSELARAILDLHLALACRPHDAREGSYEWFFQTLTATSRIITALYT